MRLRRPPFLAVALLAALLALQACGNDTDTRGPNDDRLQEEPDVGFEPTPMPVVQRMLELGEVGPGDVVYDLGSGDGRIPIAAVRDFDADSALGVEIQRGLVGESRENAEAEGVDDRVDFRHGDLFDTDLSGATVVTLYLLSELNLELRPKLLEELAPGSRVVSNSFDMGDWEPDRVEEVEAEGSTWTIYLWMVPDEIPPELRAVDDERDRNGLGA